MALKLQSETRISKSAGYTRILISTPSNIRTEEGVVRSSRSRAMDIKT